MKILNVYIVHYENLKQRVEYMKIFEKLMQKYAEKYKFMLKLNIISEPSPIYVSQTIESLNKRVNYDKEKEEDEFNSLITPLNIHQISNIEIHRSIYKLIMENENRNDEYHFIVEDDVIINEIYIANIEEMIKKLLNAELNEYDILFTCIANINNDKELSLVLLKNSYKVLLNKSSYFIKPQLAENLYKYLEVFKYNLKVGISKYLNDNPHVKSYVLNKHTLLEGSKIGIFTSSVNTSNFLFQNVEYVKLVNISKQDNVSKNDIIEAEKIYESQKHLNNPDILHTMGLIYYRVENFEKSKEFMYKACEKIHEGDGIISKNSSILNNAINVHKYDQDMLESCISKPSKYI